MKPGMLLLIAFAGAVAVPHTARAQELSVEEIRANLKAQVGAKEQRLQNRTPAATRGIKINNGTGDYVGDLYAPRERPVPPPTRLSFPVEFDLNSSKITANSFRQLYKVAQAMRDPELAGQVWMIVGHTDSRGSNQRNMTLSEQRARAVAEILDQLEAKAKFFPTGRGEEEPLEGVLPTDPKNRRVEIFPAGEK